MALPRASRRALPVLLALAVVSAPLEARVRRRQQKPPVVVTMNDTDDLPEAIEEARRKAGKRPMRLEPAAGRASGPVPAGAALPVEGGPYRPRDVLVNNPAYDGFPAGSHTEPSIAMQGDALVCAFNDGGTDFGSPNPARSYNADGFSISSDGGTSFADQGKRAPLGTLTSFTGDNVIAAGPDGDFYYVSDAGRNDSFLNALGVSRSTSGGRSWNDPTDPAAGLAHRFTDGFWDKPWIAVDRSSGPTRGNVYVTWSDFSFAGFATDLWVARSTDRGSTWRARKLDSFSHPIAVTYVQVASNGTVWVGEQDEGTFANGRMTGTNYLRSSTDGGLTWSARKTVAPYETVGDAAANALCDDPGFFGGLVRYLNGPIEADSSLRIAVDPTDPTGKTVVVVTHAVPADRAGDASDVVLWKTTDGGETFLGPVRVNDDTTTTDQFMPDLWFAPDGTLGVLWLDRRNDPANWRLEAWMALSRDAGGSFGPSFPVSSRAFPPVGVCQMSDYNGVFADASRWALAWGDARQNDFLLQTTGSISAAMLPLAGPGPLVSLARFVVSPDRASVHLTLVNDGLAPAAGLDATVTLEGSPDPGAAVPVPEIPAAHASVEVTVPLPPLGASVPFAKAALRLSGAAGSSSYPFAFSRAPGADLGRRLAVDFETPTSDFTPASSSLWHVTSTCAAADAGHSGARVAYFGIAGQCTYDAQIESTPIRVAGALTSRPVFLPRGAALLRFNEWVGLPARHRSDFAGLQISTDGGLSFENVWSYGRMTRFTAPASLALTGADGRPAWHPVSVDVSDYSGREVVFRFFFHGIGKPFPGYAVDDVEVFAVAEGPDAAFGTCAAPMRLALADGVHLASAANDASAPAGFAPSPCGAAADARAFFFELTAPRTGRWEIAAESRAFSPALAAASGAACPPATVASSCEAGRLVLDLTAGTPIRVAVTSRDGGAGAFTLRATPLSATSESLVPVVLDVVSGFGAYTTELALANHAAEARTLRLEYTAAFGARLGSGTVTETVGAGRQLRVDDAIAYLRGKGLAIPPRAAGPQGGTLRVLWDGADALVTATARTVSPTNAPQPAGLATVSYPAVLPSGLFAERAFVFGLGGGSARRSKVALYNGGAAPLTLRVTAFGGSGDGASAVVHTETLAAYGFHQVEDVLGAFASGWAVVERLGGTGRFGAYGVVNDDATNDGSVIPAVEAGGPGAIPVVVESGRFATELSLTNTSAGEARVVLSYRESLDPAGGGGDATLSLAPRTQRTDLALDLLRALGIPAGAKGGSYAGVLAVSVSQGDAAAVAASARTAAPSPSGGSFGLFTPSTRGTDADRVFLDGLRGDSTTRSNVAVANLASASQTFSFQAFDGDTGLPAGGALAVTLGPGGWAQPYRFFASLGVANGYVVVTRTQGSGRWLAYAVLNDGGEPGQRTDDGAYVTMRE